MCEIAIARTDVVKANMDGFIDGLCKTLYQSNSDGFGIAAVHRDEEADTFDYDVVKAETPDWGKVRAWVDEKLEAWRFIVHARLATAGGTGFTQSHPLYVPDDDIETDWVIHNGIVHGSKRKRNQLKQKGHEFRTEVDSEVIPHYHEELPDQDELEDYESPKLYGRLNYLLLAEDKIFIRNTGKYTITEDFRMSCRDNWIEDDCMVDEGYAVVTPDGEFETTDIDTRSTGTTIKTTYGGNRGNVVSYGHQRYGSTSGRTRDSDSSRGGVTNTIAKAQFKPGEKNLETRLGTGEGYRLSCASTRYNGERYVAVSVHDEDTGEPVPDARLTVFADDYDYDYDGSGVSDTNQMGERYLPMPSTNQKIHVWLMNVPDRDIEDECDSDDEDCIGDQTHHSVALTDSEIDDVEWWHHYDKWLHGEQKKSGFCSMHNAEFEGDCCTDCLREFSREVLLGSMNEAYDHYDETLQAD